VEEAKPGTFIYECEDALPVDICEKMISLFELYEGDQEPGITSGGVNLSIKVSTDVKISGKSHWNEIDGHLFGSLAKLLQAFPDKEWMYGANIEDAGYQMQRTDPGGFYKPHYDGNGSGVLFKRQLAVLWYLSDDHEGGHTLFPRFDVDITPKTGKALLFPPFWTHIHEGQMVTKGSKYIATTWIS